MINYKEFERTYKLLTLIGESIFKDNEYEHIIKYLIEVSVKGYVVSNIYGSEKFYGYMYDDTIMFTYMYENESMVIMDRNYFVNKLFEDIIIKNRYTDLASYDYDRDKIFSLVSDYIDNFLDIKEKESEKLILGKDIINKKWT